jgi:hypothetical protein
MKLQQKAIDKLSVKRDSQTGSGPSWIDALDTYAVGAREIKSILDVLVRYLH